MNLHKLKRQVACTRCGTSIERWNPRNALCDTCRAETLRGRQAVARKKCAERKLRSQKRYAHVKLEVSG